ncbi:MAG TPA: AMP-binding protein [Methylomirabilota bacterium]
MGADPAGGVPALSFIANLETAARRHADRPALFWENGMITYAGLWARMGGFAQWLGEQGVRPGDRVALTLLNSREFVVALLGGLVHGVTMAPLDPLLAPHERDRILADLRPALVIDKVETRVAPCTPAPPAAPALVLYTSGSTGQPKGAVLSHAALSFASQSWAGPVMKLTPYDVVLAVLPLSHSFGLNGALLAPLHTGATVVLLERFTPAAVLAAIGGRRVTVFPGVTTMFQRLLAAPELERADLSSLRIALSGAAPCPWRLCQDWQSRTGVRIVRGFGMSEAFRPISYLADDHADRADSIGRAVPGVELRIVDDAGTPLRTGAEGELWVRTPAVMDGYLGAPEETRAVLSDGWFKTGDLAVISPDGFVRIVGRKRERILRAGYSIFPSEVESLLLTHSAVAEAAVVGRPDPGLGEEVAAFVVRKAGADATPEELIAYCKERLAGYKYPRTVTFVDALPKSAAGKVLKSRLLAPEDRP